MDIPRFLQDYQMREGGGFNLSNYSVSPGNTISLRRHDGRPSVTANQKQMPESCITAVWRSQLFAETLRERERWRERKRGSERERERLEKVSKQVR